MLSQMLVVTRLGLQTLPQRTGSALVIIVCMACVVGVLLAVLAVTDGLLRAYEVAGSPGRAIVFSTDAYPGAGGRAEEDSHIPPEAVGALLSAPEVARSADGRPAIQAEALALLPPVDGFAFGSLFVRGLSAGGLAMRPAFRVTAGRLFRPGMHELMVGIGAQRVFGLKVGDQILTPDGSWPIVGAFSAGGSIMESELLGDAATVMAAINRTTSFNSVLVDLQSPARFDSFKGWLTSNPGLALTAERQSDYYRRVARRCSAFFTAVADLVGAIMALGALFGSVKILHATVDARAREIAVLRAIGYGGLPAATAVMLEAVILSLLGAMLGAWSAWLLFDGQVEGIFNAIFTLTVSARLIVLGLAWALLLAILGGLAPAIRAARLPVAEALLRRDASELMSDDPLSGALESAGKGPQTRRPLSRPTTSLEAWAAVIRATTAITRPAHPEAGWQPRL
jgi:putative ABC transport system permease protein